jgi:hypothetical protein
MFMLNLDLVWSKKKHCSSTLFINTVHHQRQRFSAAAPQPITAADPPLRRPAHQSHRAIGNSTSTPITTKTQVHVDLLPSTTRNVAATAGLCLQQPKSALQTICRNHQWLAPSSNSTSRNATIHSALAFSSDNGSTGPRPAATPQTPQPLPSHRRAQAESRSPVSCAITVSNGNRSQEVGKKETEARKIINPTTPATRHLPR